MLFSFKHTHCGTTVDNLCVRCTLKSFINNLDTFEDGDGGGRTRNFQLESPPGKLHCGPGVEAGCGPTWGGRQHLSLS